jgi:hypothetical protein
MHARGDIPNVGHRRLQLSRRRRERTDEVQLIRGVLELSHHRLPLLVDGQVLKGVSTHVSRREQVDPSINAGTTNLERVPQPKSVARLACEFFVDDNGPGFGAIAFLALHSCDEAILGIETDAVDQRLITPRARELSALKTSKLAPIG